MTEFCHQVFNRSIVNFFPDVTIKREIKGEDGGEPDHVLFNIVYLIYQKKMFKIKLLIGSEQMRSYVA
jgi:hypothetical protein